MKLSQIRQECRQKMNRAIQNTYEDANNIIEQSFSQYYAGGMPRVYERTNTLRGSKNVESPYTGGDYVYLRAGYDGGAIGYSTGTFSGMQVLDATMSGTAGVVGDPSYDEMAFNNIILAAQKNFGNEFG